MSPDNVGKHIGKINGLDGLRAISVIAVLFYHAHLPYMLGGYLGVEIFFVISGFLITSLLLAESRKTGRIDLVAFWKRRLLRLLPALLALLFLTTLVGAFILGEQASQFRMDIIASLFYVENWYQIHSGNSYFAEAGLPLLRHIWSLSIEEQFYLIWPPLVAGCLWLSKGRRILLGIVTSALLLASVWQGIHIFQPDEATGAKFLELINRVYLGTDTRAFGILAGALFAMLPFSGSVNRWQGRLFSLIGVVALGELLLLCVTLDASKPFLYQGGFALVDALTLAVIVVLVVDGNGLFAALLAWKPLEYIGQRSYGIYLWHWPIFKLVGNGDADNVTVLLNFAATFIAAEVSFRYLESPIRRGELGVWLSAGHAGVNCRRAFAGMIACCCMFMWVWSGLLLSRQVAYVDEVMESMRLNSVVLDGGSRKAVEVSRGQNAQMTEDGKIVGVLGGEQAPSYLAQVVGFAGEEQPEGGPKVNYVMARAIKDIREGGVGKQSGKVVGHSWVGQGKVKITAVGDSVMKGAAIALNEMAASSGAVPIVINAEESRSFGKAYEVLHDYKSKGLLGDIVIIHLGTNNSDIPEEQFNRLTDMLSDRRLILFVNAKSDKVKICDGVNEKLAQLASGVKNARVFDWKTVAEGRPDMFYSDKTHLRQTGARFYAEALFSRISQVLKSDEKIEYLQQDTGLKPSPPVDEQGDNKSADALHILLIGDSFMQGYGPALKMLLSKNGATVVDVSKPSTGLVMKSKYDWHEQLSDLLDKHAP